jgi:hypothetical protein
MEQRAVIMFCIKLKKTANETCEILRKVHVDKYLPRTSVFECKKGSKQDNSNYKMMNGKAVLQLLE